MYNDIVLDHFSNPRNVGEILNADGIGQIKNASDGDNITIYIKVENGILTDVKFRTLGCGAAIASSSMVTLMATGKTIAEAMEIKNEDVSASLGGLPPNKLKCSNTAADALHIAIADYKSKE